MLLWGLAQTTQAQDYLAQAQAQTNPSFKVELLYRALEQTGPTTDIFWELGWAHISLGLYQTALDDFGKGLVTEAGGVTKASFYAARGYAFYLLDQYPEAVRELDQALAESPRYTFAMRYRAYALIALERFREAESQLTTHIEVDPEDGRGYYIRAGVRMQLNTYETALQDIEKALEITPGDLSYALRKVRILIELGREDEVQAFAQSLVDFNTGEPSSYVRLAEVFRDNGDYTNALHFYDVAFRKHKEKAQADPVYRGQVLDFDYTVWLGRGYVYYLQGQYEDALNLYTTATQEYPKRWQGFKQLGNLCIQMQNWTKAIQAYEKLFSLNPTHTEGWVNLGYAYSETADYRAAISTYTRALGVEGVESKGLIYNNRGFIYLETFKNYAAAQKDFELSIAENPDLAMAYVSMGELYLFQQQYREAIPWFDKAMSVSSRNLRESYFAQLRRGTCYRFLEEWEPAYNDLLRAIRLSPIYGDAYFAMGFVQEGLGDYCQAMANFNQAASSRIWSDEQRNKEAAIEYRRVQLKYSPDCQ